MTDAQREAVARVLHKQHLGADAAIAHCSAEELGAYLARADEIIAAYEAAAPEDLRPTLICRTCGLTAIVEPPKDPTP